MLLNRATLDGIVNGSISLQFRRWKRPTVKRGGTLLTAAGQLAIEDVEPIDIGSITTADAQAAGFADLESLRAMLRSRGSGQIYRIRLSLGGPDPRVALRNEPPSTADVDEIRTRLARLDARSTAGAWTMRALRAIRDRPGERAALLAEDVDLEKARFKTNVAKLKGLGLTESLEVGYRLSPRGRSFLERASEDIDRD